MLILMVMSLMGLICQEHADQLNMMACNLCKESRDPLRVFDLVLRQLIC